MVKQMEQIQISYEHPTWRLSENTEELVRTSMLKLLAVTGNSTKTISLFFCYPATIQSLNNNYRGIDKSTDILSWQYDETEMSPEFDIWGEFAICIDLCEQQAADNGWPFETELLRLLVHGFAHLMGYDHELSDQEEQRMLEKEEFLLSSINLDGLYD